MAVVINTVTSTDKLSLINANFSTLAAAINDSLLWRNGNTAGETLFTRDVDFNGKSLLNAYVGGTSLSDIVSSAQEQVSLAEGYAQDASDSSDSAATYATNAANSASQAAQTAEDAVEEIDAILAAAGEQTTLVALAQKSGGGDTLVSHVFPAASGDSITVYDYIQQSVPLRAFHLSSDGTDYGPAVTRAAAYSSANSIAIRVDGYHLISTRPTWSSNSTFVGLGRHTGLYCADNVCVTLVYANGCSNVSISNMTINGGATTATTASVRGLRFISCTGVNVDSLWVTRTADWGTSFETCSQVRCTRHIHYGGGLGAPGGRDGIHVLNSYDVLVDDCDIASGDDCVGVTTESSFASYNIQVSNIRGASDIASVVTIGFESDNSGTFDGVLIQNISTSGLTGTSARYIVQARGVSSYTLNNVTIENVRGVSNLYGVYLQYANRATLKNINVTSLTQHGIYCSSCNIVNGSIITAGNSASGTYDGLNCSNVVRASFDNVEVNTATTYGVQFNACTYAGIRNANLTGGGTAPLRIVNNTRCEVHGKFVTSAGTYAISNTGNTYVRVQPGSEVSGGSTNVYSTIPNNGVTDEAYAYGNITQSAATTISGTYTTGTVTVAATATGVLTFTFGRAMRSSSYVVLVNPVGNSGYVRCKVGTLSTTGFTLNLDDFSGTATLGSFSFVIYNSGTTNV